MNVSLGCNSLVFGLKLHCSLVKFQVRVQCVDQLLALRICCHIPVEGFFFLVKRQYLYLKHLSIVQSGYEG